MQLDIKIKKSELVVQYNPYSADDARRLVQNRIGSPDKAKKDLKFEHKFGLQEGLNRLIKWREVNS